MLTLSIARMRRSRGRLAACGLIVTAGLAVTAGRADAALEPVSVSFTRGTLVVTGDASSQQIALRLRASAPGVLEVDPGSGTPIAIERWRFSKIAVVTGGGDDTVRIDETAGAFAGATPTTIDAGECADRVDVVGSAANDALDVSSSGSRVRLSGAAAMDLDGVEEIAAALVGGRDTLTVHDLSGTAATGVTADLAGVPGGAAGDGSADAVIVEGTDGDDSIDVKGSAAAAGRTVTGLPALVRIERPEAGDSLQVKARAGSDRVSARALMVDVPELTIDAGDGDDDVVGSFGADVLIGGDGDDHVEGERGDDVAYLGFGDDSYATYTGLGDDRIEGQAGQIACSSAARTPTTMSTCRPSAAAFACVATSGASPPVHARPRRPRAGRPADVRGHRHGARGRSRAHGATAVDVNLGRLPTDAAGDGQVDQLIVEAPSTDDAITATGSAGDMTVSGLAAVVRITRADGAKDRLAIDAGPGTTRRCHGGRGGRETLNVIAGMATTRCSAGPATTCSAGWPVATCCSAGPAPTRSSATRATTSWMAAMATTCWPAATGADVLFGRAGVDVLLGGPGDDIEFQ